MCAAHNVFERVAELAAGPRQMLVPRWRAARPAEARPGGLGDRAAEEIERRVLGPVERAAPWAAQVVQSVRGCGGCASDRARLNGDGGGSAI